MARPDVLLVSLGTTLGWRRGDECCSRRLERGVRRRPPSPSGSARPTACGAGIHQRPRRDARGTAAARTAIERHEPRALIVSSTTAAMLLPSLPMPYACASTPRHGSIGGRSERAPPRPRAPEHATRAGHNSLQRRRRRGASRRGRPAVVVSPPIDPSAPDGESEERELARRRVRARPEGEGARRGAAGWAAAAVEEAKLEVYGLDPDWGRSHLRRVGVAEPDSASSCAGPSRQPSSSAPAPRPRLRPRRPLGGLGPGAGSRRWPTAPCSRPCPRRAYEGLRVARRARALPGRGGRGAGGAGSGDPRGVRAAGRARRQLPRAGGGAAPPVPLGRGAGNRGARAPSALLG